MKIDGEEEPPLLEAAREAAKRNVQEVRRLIDQLEERIDSLERELEVNPTNWALVGDLVHVRATLTNIVERQ